MPLMSHGYLSNYFMGTFNIDSLLTYFNVVSINNKPSFLSYCIWFLCNPIFRFKHFGDHFIVLGGGLVLNLTMTQKTEQRTCHSSTGHPICNWFEADVYFFTLLLVYLVYLTMQFP